MFKKIDYLMAMVSNMEASVKFYRDALGLKLRFESPEWSEFDTGATTLALHKAVRPGGKASQGSAPGTLQIGFNVEDIESAAVMLKERGVRFIQEPTLQPREGIKLAILIDPDGMAISVAQSMRK
jgi:lactoylglutathione lyase